MNIKQQLEHHVFEEHLKTLQYLHEELGYDKDYKLYERIIVLQYCKQCSNTESFIKLLERWIIEQHSLIVYFCSQKLIEKSLEAILVSYEKYSKEIGINEKSIAIAKERLKQIKNGMEDPNIK